MLSNKQMDAASSNNNKSPASGLHLHCDNLIKKTFTPLLNAANNIFKVIKSIKSTYWVHICTKLKREPGEPEETYYVKAVNPEKNPKNFMAPLEAAYSYFYELILDRPEAIALTHAHYVADRSALIYDTVSSKEVPFFKSIYEDPFKEENFIIHELQNGMSIAELDQIEIKCRNTEDYRKYRRLIAKGEFHGDLNKTFIGGISLHDLLNYEMIKGLATGLMTSFIEEEDDTTKNNMSKFGERVDLDMSLWPLGYLYKEHVSGFTGVVNQIADWSLRKPQPNQFAFTERNILYFPELPEADPYYFPTKNRPMANYNWRSTNGFTLAENELYKKLAKHPVFIFHKFKTLLKFILTDPEMYKQIALLHADDTTKLPPQDISMADILKEHMGKRIDEARSVLINMPAFNQFLSVHGQHAMQLIAKEWTERNSRFQPLQTELDKRYPPPNEPRNIMISIETIKKRYVELKERIAVQAGQKTRFFQPPFLSLDVKEDYHALNVEEKIATVNRTG